MKRAGGVLACKNTRPDGKEWSLERVLPCQGRAFSAMLLRVTEAGGALPVSSVLALPKKVC